MAGTRRYLKHNIGAKVAVASGRYSSGFVHYSAVGKTNRLVGGLPPTSIFSAARLRFPSIDYAYFFGT